MVAGSVEPSQRAASIGDAGRACPYCRFALKEGTPMMVCGTCRAPHHLDCWTDNTGCAVLGCAGGPRPGSQSRTAPQPAVATPVVSSAIAEQTWVAPRAPAIAANTSPPSTPVPPGSAAGPPNRTGRGPSLAVAIIALALAILGVVAALVLGNSKSPSTRASVAAEPSNVTLVAGETATFTAAGSGTPTPTVQWRRSQNGGSTWVPVPGATSSTLVASKVSASQNGNEYDAVFTNRTGAATTNPAVLTVNPRPVVTKRPTVTAQPANTRVNAGQSATFTAAASGPPTPAVRWRGSQNGGATWTPLSGATSDTLIVSNVAASENGNEYDAVFANTAGTMTTNAAVLTVNAPHVTTGSQTSPSPTAYPGTVTGIDSSGHNIGVDCSDNPTNSLRGCNDGSGRGPADNLSYGSVTGADSLGYNIGIGCADDPSSSLPGCHNGVAGDGSVTTGSQTSPSQTAYPGTVTGIDSSGYTIGVDCSDNPTNSLRGCNDGSGRGPADNLSYGSVTGTDSLGYNIGIGCSDAPNSSLPECHNG